MSTAIESVDLQAPPAAIIFTDAAAAKVKDLLIEEGNDNLKLRVFVQGGGCSGFQYGFTIDEDVNDDDTTLEKNAWLNAPPPHTSTSLTSGAARRIASQAARAVSARRVA